MLSRRKHYRAHTEGGGLGTGAEPKSRLGSSRSFSSSSFVCAPNKPVPAFGGGLTPGGADPVNERSLSARWRKSDVVSVLGAATWPGESSQEPSLLRWLHGSLESWLLAMLILENRTGRSGPAKESRLTRSFPSPSAACEPCIDLLPLCTEPRFSSRSNMASLIIGVFSPTCANTRSGPHERRAQSRASLG